MWNHILGALQISEGRLGTLFTFTFSSFLEKGGCAFTFSKLHAEIW